MLIARELPLNSPEDFGPLQVRQKLRELGRGEELIGVLVFPNGNDGSAEPGLLRASLQTRHPPQLVILRQLPERWAHDRYDQSRTRVFSEFKDGHGLMKAGVTERVKGLVLSSHKR